MRVYPISFTIFYWLGAGHIFCPYSREKVTQAHTSLGHSTCVHHRKHTFQTWQRFSNFSVRKNHLGESVKIKLGFLGPVLRVSESVSPGCGLEICFAGVQLIFHLCVRQGP